MNKLYVCFLSAILSIFIFSITACSNKATSDSSGTGSFAGNSIASKTTLSALTANNTAACPADGVLPSWCQQHFKGQTDSRVGVSTQDFDPAAGNVSDEDMHSYLGQGGWGTKIFANFMLGFCSDSNSTYCHNNVQTGYTADDAKTVAAQAADLERRHIDGAILSWDGSGTTVDDAALLFQSWADRHACSGGACSLTYIIMYNDASLAYNVQSTEIPGTTGQGCSGLGGANYENCVVAHLRNEVCYMNGTHFGSPSYEKINGRPVLQIFVDEHILPITGPAPSWADVWVQFGNWVKDLPHNCAFAPYNADNGVPLIVFENVRGFAEQSSSGSFYWITPAGTDLATEQFIYNITGTANDTLDNFLATARTANGMIAFSGAFKGFNSIQANWGRGRIMDQRCGQTWMRSLTEGNKDPAGGAAYLQIATWNDYNEGTEIESGIDNCYSVTAKVNGSTLEW
jgi:hypothetical protein